MQQPGQPSDQAGPSDSDFVGFDLRRFWRIERICPHTEFCVYSLFTTAGFFGATVIPPQLLALVANRGGCFGHC
jgi:hypothetical protein